jgi:hypothetical protein
VQLEVHHHAAEITYLSDLGKTSDGRPFRDAAVERAVSAGSSYRSNAEAMGIPYSDLTKKINLTD